MRVGFFTVFRKDPQHIVLADIMVRSVRAAMPGVEIVQFTDETTPIVPGVDVVRRKPHGRMLERRLEHYADAEGDWLLLDTDVVVRHDVRDLFTRDGWSIALADRNWTHLKPTPDLTEKMPYNTGVAFSRDNLFWREVLAVWRAFPAETQKDWLSEQMAVAEVVKRKPVLTLPGMAFNYPPANEADLCTSAKIVHYKGIRKLWMRNLKLAEPVGPMGCPTGHDGPLGPPGFTPEIDTPVRVFIGYDPRQPVAFNVAAHSVQSRASMPVAITRLQLSQLPITRRGLTEFTYSRFLVPYLSGFKGWSIFLDADMLCLGDITELMVAAMSNNDEPVHVVKSDRRFEWASMMVFNNEKCTMLTPEYVGNKTLPLFDLNFAKVVGDLPRDWNHLVGYDIPNRSRAKLVHFTQGIPVWPETASCEYAEEWRRERSMLLHSVSFAELMGGSVHVQHMDLHKS